MKLFLVPWKPSLSLRAALLLAIGLPWTAAAQTTINSSQAEAWGANIGWVNAAADTTHGLIVGEYVCSGSCYGANIGWINVGNGSPANHIYYANQSAADFGVNFQPTGGGYAVLRGFAYGANIGWINFETQGNPRVYLTTGQFSGYAYSANCGWINLGDLTYYLKTDRIVPGVDSDGDGIADAYEYQYFGNLTTANATSSYLRDGTTDLQRYLAGVSPTDANSFPRILSLAVDATRTNVSLTFTSSGSRLYTIEKTSDLTANGSWTDSGLGMFAPDGATTTRAFSQTANARTFYRVRVQLPLR